MLVKLIAEETPQINQTFKHLKERVIKGITAHLLNEEKISFNTENYENVLDFIEYAFVRNKYRSGEDE